MLGSNCWLDLLPRSTWILFLLCLLSLTNFIENELFLTTSLSVVPSEPLPGILFPPSGVFSTLPSVLPDGAWVAPSAESAVSGALLVSPLIFPFLPASISVILVWDASPCIVPSWSWLGCCILSDVLPLVVEFSFG